LIAAKKNLKFVRESGLQFKKVQEEEFNSCKQIFGASG